VLWGYMFLDERITRNMLAGGMLVLAGLSLALHPRSAPRRETPAARP
jgi:drug/metabolite transporter (DMT)-like permease